MKTDSLATSCPTCGAAAGQPCVLITGEPRNQSHRDRRVIAADLPVQKRARQTNRIAEPNAKLRFR